MPTSARAHRPGAERPPRQLAVPSRRRRAGRSSASSFAFNSLAMRLGKPSSPVVFDAARLNGSFAGANFAATSPAPARPSARSRCCSATASGTWLYRNKNLTRRQRAHGLRPQSATRASIRCGATTCISRSPATTSARPARCSHPATGTLVTDVGIEHRLSTGAGHASLDVPGLDLRPELPARPADAAHRRRGRARQRHGRGQGRIDWAAGGKVTSTGDFSTANMDLAAPFGPVTGLTTTIHFTDLLGLETRAGPGR